MARKNICKGKKVKIGEEEAAPSSRSKLQSLLILKESISLELSLNTVGAQIIILEQNSLRFWKFKRWSGCNSATNGRKKYL